MYSHFIMDKTYKHFKFKLFVKTQLCSANVSIVAKLVVVSHHIISWEMFCFFKLGFSFSFLPVTGMHVADAHSS